MTEQEYNKCVEKHANNLYRFVLKNIKDEDKASDIVQDAYEKMWVQRIGIDAEKSKSYLFTTAYHILIDYVRKDKRMVPLEETTKIEPYYETGYSDLSEILNKALDRLPEKQKMVLLMRDYEGYSYEEIGEITTLSESQVKVYIYRARLFLKNYLCKQELVI
ncbi:MAG: RNA polymerase sigma factor [Marinilabiliaceae bacterium]|nr:RNA polymerase sigma factor [Marinilabiliaceae bacterium]